MIREIMYVSRVSYTLTTLCFFRHILIIFASSQPGSIAISCGSSGTLTGSDGRLWVGDSALVSSFPFHIIGKSSNSRAIHKLDHVLYKTARTSRNEFSYVFPVKSGQKIIRLHFHQDNYKGFKKSKALFTVKAGPYTLLSNFSTALTSSNPSSLKQIIKEYCLNIENDDALIITFTPSQKTKKSDDFYAFVNCIEVVSVPTGLYFTPEGELGARVVGQNYRFYIDNNTALEMVLRLNVGGTAILPAEDSSMFRRWDEDSIYLLETGVISSMILISFKNRGSPTYIAPRKVYQTTRSIYATNTKSGASNLTWRIAVDLGFRYLIRLHFSELQPRTAEGEFVIIINNQIAENNCDVLQGASQVAICDDYIVMIEGDKMAGKRNLTITFQPKFYSRDIECSMNGLEVFKLSNPDNNLAGMESILESHSTSTPQPKKLLTVYRSNLIATVLTVILALLNTVVYHLTRVSDTNSGTKNIRTSSKHPCRQFSIEEIRLSTNNFDPKFHIGSGGYGRVFKGHIDGGDTVVAIKRMRPESKQGDNEFWTEIKMLSKIRHQHLVSLIGYCNDGHERILVYLYMNRGTLCDHLYKINRHGKSILPLSWELRLKVSVGAARGLYYLHSRHRIIHRDVKSSNILLDENWIAKISDFGLSKMGHGKWDTP